MQTKTKLTHSSTNPHYVEGADEVIAEKSFSNTKPCTLITNPSHHNDIVITKPGKKRLAFVKTCNVTGEVRRIAD